MSAVAVFDVGKTNVKLFAAAVEARFALAILYAALLARHGARGGPARLSADAPGTGGLPELEPYRAAWLARGRQRSDMP